MEPFEPSRRLLLLVVCAASSVRHTCALVNDLQQRGWSVRVVCTLEASSWLDHERLREMTGFPPLTQAPEVAGEVMGEPVVLVVAPGTFNTIGQLASGLMNSFALAVVHEAIGRGTRTILLPHVSKVLNASNIFQRALVTLEQAGVLVIRDGSVCEGGCAVDAHVDPLLGVVGCA